MTDRADNSSQSVHSAHRILALAGLVVALTVRLYRLGAESLWYDETVSAYLARVPLSDMLAHTALDIHPPGYYALLHYWSSLSVPFGLPSLEFSLAWPSVWFGVLAIALLFPIGRLLLGRTPATLAVWLAALNPFLIWYGQEVRMYTVAGALGLLSLYAALRFLDSIAPQGNRPPSTTRQASWLALYAVAAAAGLYTLYYFAFVIVSINLAMVATLVARRRRKGTSEVAVSVPLLEWLAAQLVALFLFAAWLPILVRQALSPPVPAWREPWRSILSPIQDAASALSAYVMGQSVPERQVLLWAALALIILIAYYGYTKYLHRYRRRLAQWSTVAWLPLYVLVPPVTIFLISAIATPIYHVRYMATYAPAFSLITAAGLTYFWHRRRGLFALLAGTLFIGSVFSMSRYWRHPDYRPDDHRAAVAYLADAWRPGDAILVNAGWVYTAIDTYWPGVLVSSADALPPGPVDWQRLGDEPASGVEVQSEPEDRLRTVFDSDRPTGTKTGSVDGAPTLGWGNEEADFFAISESETVEALDALDADHARIWHYRLYDTVNDADGIIRAWLEENLDKKVDSIYPGTGFLTLQRFDTDEVPSLESGENRTIRFGDRLEAVVANRSEAISAGSYLYLPVEWSPLPALPAGENLASSLRLVDREGVRWAQHDEPMPDLLVGALRDHTITQVLALPIRADTPPGDYAVELVVYNADDLVPLSADAASGRAEAAVLGGQSVELPSEPPRIDGSLSRFDYIDLLQAHLPVNTLSPADDLRLDLLWLPQRSAYRDNYTAQITLLSDDGSVAAQWEEALGPTLYPSSTWATGFPVRQQVDLSVPRGLEPGDYSMELAVIRSSDRLRIPSRPIWPLPLTRSSYELGTITIAE